MKTPTIFALAFLSATAIAGGLAMAQTAATPETAKPETAAPAQTQPQAGERGRGYRRHEGRGYGRGERMGHGEGRGQGRGEGRGEGRGMGMGRAAMLDPAQLAARKSALGITPAQENLWKEYAGAVETFAEARKGREAIDRDKVRAMSADERQKFRTGMREAMQKNRDALIKARTALVAALSDEQKAKVPSLTRAADARGDRMGGRGRDRGERHGHGYGRGDHHGRGHHGRSHEGRGHRH